MKKMLFIFNPNTGGGRLKTHLMEILRRFSAAGYELSVWPTHAMGDARNITKQRAHKADLVVCCGGDGTLNEVVDGMMHLEKPPLLGYIPGGTTCDYAVSLLLPKANLLAAAERILHPKKIFQSDVGLFNGRAFNYVAAFGAFTDVPYKTSQKAKNMLGYFAYILEGAQRLPKLRTRKIHFCSEEREFTDDYLLGMVTNSSSVGGFSFPDKQKVRLDDGRFEVVLVRRPQNIAQLGELSSALLRGHFSSPLLDVMRVRHAKIVTEQPLDWTLDGEFGGNPTETVIDVRQKAIQICV